MSSSLREPWKYMTWVGFYDLPNMSNFLHITRDLPTEVQSLILALIAQEYFVYDCKIRGNLDKTRSERLLLFKFIINWYSSIPLTIEFKDPHKETPVTCHFHLRDNICVQIKLNLTCYPYVFRYCHLYHLKIDVTAWEEPFLLPFIIQFLEEQKPAKFTVYAKENWFIWSEDYLLKEYATEVHVSEKKL
ncbi:unnamed protein product [Ambrosiozyma monospora]|uniref:Unnamed protein product n=1 Tax=Ambrosiozyma monospora TaxID=43982 RepID=A0ACB5T3B1_AMBMO|nr:unnamed protein product [Ambrosiozyma monospora]